MTAVLWKAIQGLKVLYDAADIIRDIRFERSDEELNNILNQLPDNPVEDPLIEEIQDTAAAPNESNTSDKPNKENKFGIIKYLN